MATQLILALVGKSIILNLLYSVEQMNCQIFRPYNGKIIDKNQMFILGSNIVKYPSFNHPFISSKLNTLVVSASSRCCARRT
jgi:hypothetical protein